MPSNRGQLINYGVRQLGAPVLEINIADDQLHDAVNAATSVPLVGVEGTFNNSNTLIREGQSGGTSSLAAPSSVATTYVNKPHWTSTLDGGTF